MIISAMRRTILPGVMVVIPAGGHRGKTVLTDTGPVEISVPRDRDASFEPKIVGKRQRRLTGVDDMVISLSAKGLTHGEIAAHLAEVYGAEVSKQTITAITDRVMEGLADWQSRPLDAGLVSTDGCES
jgi:putative transposase